MAIRIFPSFQSTVTPFKRGMKVGEYNVLEDPTTGAPVGIQTKSGAGPDGIWTPVDITAAQLASPTPLMIADLNATYRLNVAPYTRYQSNGEDLVALGGGDIDTIPPDGIFGTIIIWSPFVVSDPAGVNIQGTAYVRSVPA